MKKIKAIFAIFLTCTLFATAPACSLIGHKHKWNNYIVKIPTCKDAGLLEKICDECGEKEYKEIKPSGHDYQNGACTVCGAYGYSEYELEPIPMPENANNTAAWNFQKIYDTMQSIYPQSTWTYQHFLNSLSYGNLSSIYTDNLGFLHFTVTFTNTNNKEMVLPLLLSVSKVSPTNSKESKFGNISTVRVINEQLVFVYSDGLQVSAGKFRNSDVTITSFGLNTNNEVVVYYSNNTIAFAGKIPEGKAAETQANFIYQAVNGGYEIFRALNLNKGNVVKIPVSHQGKPIVSISDNAFDTLADSLQAIVIPSSVTTISYNAFSGLKNSTRLYFEGARGTISYPSSLTAYFAGEWSYVNGIPTPNN